ncbi:hypothetical protein [Streptomyces misionensis]
MPAWVVLFPSGLRLHDHPPLRAAPAAGDEVVRCGRAAAEHAVAEFPAGAEDGDPP